MTRFSEGYRDDEYSKFYFLVASRKNLGKRGYRRKEGLKKNKRRIALREINFTYMNNYQQMYFKIVGVQNDIKKDDVEVAWT